MATKNRVLSREEILSASKRPMERVHIPEWGGDVFVQGLTGDERDNYEQTVMERRRDGTYVPNLRNARARLIVVSLVNEDGSVMFQEREIAEIGKLPARALQIIWDKAAELSGLSESDVELLEGNSDGALPDGSSSDSQDTSGGRSKASQSKFQAVS